MCSVLGLEEGVYRVSRGGAGQDAAELEGDARAGAEVRAMLPKVHRAGHHISPAPPANNQCYVRDPGCPHLLRGVISLETTSESPLQKVGVG